MKRIICSILITMICLSSVLQSAAQRFYAPLPLGQSVFDTDTKVPIAVQYYLPSWCLGDAKRMHSWAFLSDIADSVCLVRSSFYKNTGYDRGHMMAAADRSFDLGVMKATFVMSNVAPQAPALNRGQWAKAEEEVRGLAKKLGEVKVYNAPIFFLQDTDWIYPGRVAIPHAFLKVAMNVQCDTIYRVYFFLNR